IPEVRLNFGKPEEKKVHEMTVAEAKKYIKEGHFAEGSMKPKIEAAVQFLTGGKKRKVLITDAASLTKAMKGGAGTWIVN
ncbi:MAG: carbamate kinase, partial [Candidatus Paceibacterota bacterium]